jgi:hypothetical protein
MDLNNCYLNGISCNLAEALIMTMAEFKFPNPFDKEIESFRALHQLGGVQQLDYIEVDPKYKGDFCHASAKHAAQSGGKRVHGWALWKHKSGCIVGNFHSVWENEKGDLIDVTPPKVGDKILFIRDDTLTIKKTGQNHQLFNNRTSDLTFKIIDIEGQPTSANRFDLPIQKDLIDYCEPLGWSDGNMA